MAKGKANRKKPSRKRYEDEHATVSFRLKSKGSYKRLHEYLEATGSSLSDLVEEALNKLPIKMLDIAKIKQEAYEKGKDDGFRLWF